MEIRRARKARLEGDVAHELACATVERSELDGLRLDGVEVSLQEGCMMFGRHAE
ncbi:MAG TPA: hypothetical protein RMH99_19900 [Sandaracinaceae bacterium LLY-WYZ-13_1]|nr:hypothetical protein [Sandaracinaceae bacterium LLY-WYZ-13_1]